MLPAAALLGLQIGSSLISAYSQNKAAKRQAEAAMKGAANRYNATLGQMENVYRQTNDQATQRAQAIVRQAQSESATMFAQVSDMGLSGGSVDRMARSTAFAASDDLTANETSRSNAQMQNFQTALGAKDQYDSEVNQAKSFWQQNRPSWTGLAFQIGGSFLGQATRDQQFANAMPSSGVTGTPNVTGMGSTLGSLLASPLAPLAGLASLFGGGDTSGAVSTPVAPPGAVQAKALNPLDNALNGFGMDDGDPINALFNYGNAEWRARYDPFSREYRARDFAHRNKYGNGMHQSTADTRRGLGLGY